MKTMHSLTNFDHLTRHIKETKMRLEIVEGMLSRDIKELTEIEKAFLYMVRSNIEAEIEKREEELRKVEEEEIGVAEEVESLPSDFSSPGRSKMFEMLIKARNLATPLERVWFFDYDDCTFKVDDVGRLNSTNFKTSLEVFNGVHDLALYYYPHTRQYVYRCGDKAVGFDKEELENLED